MNNLTLRDGVTYNFELLKAFNAINGYPENTLRGHLNWQEKYSPSRANYCENILLDLILPTIANNILVVKQVRLNAYLKSIETERRYFLGDPIVHFVSDTKRYLVKASLLTHLLMGYGVYIAPIFWIYPIAKSINTIKIFIRAKVSIIRARKTCTKHESKH
jgi:hypothetical protein